MGHGKETPRQKMIGMMYLVLTALLALNVSADVLNAFALVDEGLVRTTANFVTKNASAYDVFEDQMEKSPTRVEPFRDMAHLVKDKADQLAYDLQQLKVEIIKYCDGAEAPSITPTEWLVGVNREKKPTYEVNGHLIQSKDNMDKPAELMILKGKGAELKKKIEEYRDFLITLTNDQTLQNSIREGLNTDVHQIEGNKEPHTWESSNFEHLPMVAVITNLSKIQGDVRNAEADIIQNLLYQIGASDTRVNKMEAIVLTSSNYVLRGGQFEARILLAAYDSLQKPEILLGPYQKTDTGYEMVNGGTPLAYDEKGRAMLVRSATSVGDFNVQGLLRMQTPEGLRSYPFSTDYQVGEPNAVVSPTKMNVLYIGVDNPLEVSVSGVPAENIRTSINNGTLNRSGGGYIAKPATEGNAIVRVTANSEDQTKEWSFPYRVKKVPPPIAKVGGRTGGDIAKETLAAQQFVVADLEGFDFEYRYTVRSFQVNVPTGGGFFERDAVQGNRIPEKYQGLIRNLSRGTAVYFNNIVVEGPGQAPQTLPGSVVFNIQ